MVVHISVMKQKNNIHLKMHNSMKYDQTDVHIYAKQPKTVRILCLQCTKNSIQRIKYNFPFNFNTDKP